jgi:hypothetical protein
LEIISKYNAILTTGSGSVLPTQTNTDPGQRYAALDSDLCRIRILDESERSTINYGGRWVAKLREMGGQVGSAPACYGSSLGSNPDISQKYKMCDISNGLANTLKPAKKIYKKN